MKPVSNTIVEITARIREMREISGFSFEEMAQKTEVSVEQYEKYESGEIDLPFTFIHNCALAFGIDLTELLEGHSAKLSSYTITRKGAGHHTAKEAGIEIRNLAPLFRNKLAEPYFVKYEYSQELQSSSIHLTKHTGQEFDFVMSGSLKVQVGDKIEYLEEGDSIYYNSSTPHGMIATGGKDCLFLAVVLSGDETAETHIRQTLAAEPRESSDLICSKYLDVQEDESGVLKKINFKNHDKFNFAFDIVDEIADRYPEKTAMVYLSKEKEERIFTFDDIKRASARSANYFKALGIKKGDRVMLVLKRHYQFWYAILGLHKLGAVAIPATNQLLPHDFEYRFNAAGVSAIVCTSEDNVPEHVEQVQSVSPTLKTKILVGGNREGWNSFDDEFPLYRSVYDREEDTPCGDDPMIMFFTSGTTGYPKIATHSYKYALGHFVTAKYWHAVRRDGLHFTISDTGWGKALWGKLYGQWLCEGAVFIYNFDRYSASDILSMFSKYQITTFCAPPTMLRMMIREDLSSYDLSSIKHMTTAGEALNPEVYYQFEKVTGIKIMEGFGQTETTLAIANLAGSSHKVGSMGRANPAYDIQLFSNEGEPVTAGETGEIVINTQDITPCGLFLGYYGNDEKTNEVWHDGYYHTGDLAWQDEDGFFWYVGRSDDVIKSSGYRIGPFEIESIIMELPYILECGVSAAPDEIRGQVVKASIVLTKDATASDELKNEIQEYVKHRTAPYKYPRIVVFRDSLPKTISGKIQRNKL